MKILIIPSFIFTKQNETLGSFIFEQAIALKQAGNDVYMLYCDTFSLKEFFRFVNYQEETVSIVQGIEIIRDKCLCPLKHDSGFKGSRNAFSRRILQLYKKYLSDVKFDIIHAHCSVWAGCAAQCISEETGIPYVITEHSTLFTLGSDKIKGREEKAIREAFSSSRKNICVSAALQQVMTKFSDNTTILGNVIDCGLFRLPQSRNINSNFTFLSVCYLGTEAQLRKKGIDVLLDAFKLVTESFSHVHLNIGGGGKALSIVELWIRDRELQKYVTLLGPLSRIEVAEKMRECDVFVLPSRYETFGVVYAEAMACGKPVIGTKTGGPDSFVSKECGVLVDVENASQLAAAMGKTIDNYDQYSPYEIRKKVVENFSMEAIARSLETIYSGG